MIGNKIADKITSVSNKKLPNNNERKDVEITTHKKRYISPEERQKIIDELRLVAKNYWWINVSIKVALQCIKMKYQKIRNLLGNASNQPF